MKRAVHYFLEKRADGSLKLSALCDYFEWFLSKVAYCARAAISSALSATL